MIILSKRFLMQLCGGWMLCCALSACGTDGGQARVETQTPRVETQTPREAAEPQSTIRTKQGVCTEELQGRMKEIAGATAGPVGAAVMMLEGGEVASFNGGQRFPMQSVYKLPIAMAVLRRVDAGTLKLDEKVKVESKEYVSGQLHSPLRDRYPRGVELSVRELLRYMVMESDGTACDVLLRLMDGAEQVTKYLRESGVEGITVATTEGEMSRDEMAQYRNWATPEAMLSLLRLLHEGKTLSAASRGLLLELMTSTPTGPRRIKGMLPAGTVVAHKTGTSATVDGLTRATNDVGLIKLPDGRYLALAVFVSDTKAEETVREGVIAKIARAGWDCWTRNAEARGK